MSSYTSTGRAKHVGAALGNGTSAMTANTADTVVLAKAYTYIEIVNDDPANTIYVKLARGTDDSTFTPATVGGDDCVMIGPGAVRFMVDDPSSSNPNSRASLISSAAATGYHVIGHMELPR